MERYRHWQRKQVTAYQLPKLKNLTLGKPDGFENYATLFELYFSALIKPNKPAFPVVDSSQNVVGHVGWFDTENTWVAYPKSYDIDKIDEARVPYLSALLEQGVPVYIMPEAGSHIDQYKYSTYGQRFRQELRPYRNITQGGGEHLLLTTIDGEVTLFMGGHSIDGVEPVSMIDIVLTVSMVGDLAELGANIVRRGAGGLYRSIRTLMLKGGAGKIAREGAAAIALDEAKLKLLVIKVWNEQRAILVKVVKAERGPSAMVGGYITNEKFVLGRAPAEMERILGLPAGELGDGAHIMRLNRLPTSEEFELRGYTNTPDGKTYIEGVSDPRYPPGLGAPQWQIKRGVQIPSTPAKFVRPGETYTLTSGG